MSELGNMDRSGHCHLCHKLVDLLVLLEVMVGDEEYSMLVCLDCKAD